MNFEDDEKIYLHLEEERKLEGGGLRLTTTAVCIFSHEWSRKQILMRYVTKQDIKYYVSFKNFSFCILWISAKLIAKKPFNFCKLKKLQT